MSKLCPQIYILQNAKKSCPANLAVDSCVITLMWFLQGLTQVASLPYLWCQCMVRSAGSEGPEGRDSQAELVHTCVRYHTCPFSVLSWSRW